MSNKNKESVPDLGSPTFNCKFCGKGGVVWKEVRTDVWRPYDTEQNKVHSCTVREDEEYLEYQKKNTGSITLESLVENLKLLGFEYFVPRTSSWKFALIKSNDIQTVYFLIGRLGVDFKLYDYVRDTNIDDNGKLYTDGGLAVRNYYLGSDINVHHLILKVANQLANNISIDDELLTGQGQSVNKRRIDEKSKLELAQKDIDVEKEIYNKSHATNAIAQASNKVLNDDGWMHEIWEWAEEFKIPETIVPKNKKALLALKKLSISGYNVTFLPEGIGNLSNLEEFHDWYGNLISLPESMSNLSNLKSLYIVGSAINFLPESIGDLKNLKNLEISISTKLVSIPESIGNLKNLELLNIFSNRLSFLPEGIGNLSNLRTLNASCNRLDSLPNSIENLGKLEELFIENNTLFSLPDSIGNLSNLKTLNASNNELVELPSSMGNLKNLKSLDIHSNKISSLSETMEGLISNLEVLCINDSTFKIWLRNIDFSEVNLDIFQTKAFPQDSVYTSTFNYLTGIDEP